MKKGKVPYHFYCDLYYMNFYFCMGWKKSDMKSYFNADLDETARGTTISTPSGVIIWIDSSDSLGALAHESVHAAKFVFSQKGVLASNDNDEPLAYLVQWIFEKCLKKVKRIRKISARV